MSQTLNTRPGGTGKHPYEESARISPGGFVGDIHQRIKEDLSTFGEVVEIKGEINLMRRYGILFKNVEAILRHPRIRMLMTVKVEWRSDDNSLHYTNQLGYPLRLTPQSWDQQNPLSTQERELMDAVMDRLDEHEVWSPWGPKQSVSEKAKAVAIGSGGGVGAGMVAAGEMAAATASPVSLIAGLMIVGVTGGSLAGGKLVTGRSAAHARKINVAVEKWNEDQDRSFSSLFTSSEEKSEFIDAFLALCESTGILSYEGGLAVTRAPLRQITNPRDHHELLDMEVEERYSGEPLVATSMLQFKGILHGHERGYFLFDGRHFYSYCNYPERFMAPLA